MGGGLMQLVSGAQMFTLQNPQITFWKVTYRRHTNFAMGIEKLLTDKPISAAVLMHHLTQR